MKRIFLTGLGLYLGWLEYGDDVLEWLPAFGASPILQTLILGLAGLTVFGTVIWTGYRALCWVFE